MGFKTDLLIAPPDTVPIYQFMLDDKYGRYPLKKSGNPFTCGLSGRTYSALDIRDRVEFLARALSRELGWQPNQGTEWDKVVGIFALNTVRYSQIKPHTAFVKINAHT